VAEFRPNEILGALGRHGVRYVLIGGYAAVMHGSNSATFDVDVTPEDDRANLERLSLALTELEAKIRTTGEPGGVRFELDGRSLGAVRVWNLTTKYGDLDISFEPSGTTGYKDLARDATRLTIDGVDIPVASLADVVRSKEAAGRPKDQLTLPTLRRMLEEGRPT
jgi:hypothetical protein